MEIYGQQGSGGIWDTFLHQRSDKLNENYIFAKFTSLIWKRIDCRKIIATEKLKLKKFDEKYF